MPGKPWGSARISITTRTSISHCGGCSTSTPITTRRTSIKRKRKRCGGRFAVVSPASASRSARIPLSDQLLVVTPIKDSPAYKAGIKAGDIITTVTRDVDSLGKPLNPPEVISTQGMSLTDAVEKITGKPGSNVKLTVQREGEDKPRQFELTRDYVDVESVLGFKRKADDDLGLHRSIRKNKIGYIRLTQFAHNSYQEMLTVMKELVDAGVKGVILDLRFNPGGLLEAPSISPICSSTTARSCSIRQRGRREQEFTGNARRQSARFPDGVPGERLQRQRQRDCLGLLAGPSSCLHHRRTQLRQGQRAAHPGVRWRRDQDDHRHILAAEQKNLNKSTTAGKEEDEWGVMPNKVIKFDDQERLELEEHLHDIDVIHRKDKPAETKKFDDKQLDEGLKYLRDQIHTASRDSQKKAG